jgi:hypothetical protein
MQIEELKIYPGFNLEFEKIEMIRLVKIKNQHDQNRHRERCDECRHIWLNDEVEHFPYCRYLLFYDEAESGFLSGPSKEKNNNIMNYGCYY